MLKKEIVTHGDRSDALPTLEYCTVLGACKEEQGGRVATIDELLQKVVRMNLFVAPFRSFLIPFLLGGQPKKKEKERKLCLQQRH